jgi:DNA mismatch endonuclease (patch repair protein)
VVASSQGATAQHRRARSWNASPSTSARMARIKRSGSAPELRVRSVLYALGARYRTRNPDLPGSPDVANRAQRWAVFVHGCFWHGHSCRRALVPRRNRSLWVAKFARNRRRDQRVIRALRRLGFIVVVVWECCVADELKLTEYLMSALGPHFRVNRRASRHR